MAHTPSPPAAAPSFAPGWRAVWRRRGPAAWALWPASLLYRALRALHLLPYRLGWRRAQHAGVPVIVVGNVIAGGAGKTPVTLAVVQQLKALGWQPGIVSRGYGRSTQDCREALPDSAPALVGDEPALLARATLCPVFVASQRIQAVQALRQRYPQVDVIVSDDGLQHQGLARDIELCVFNDEGLGNGFLLPAGPLREPWPRPVTAVLYAGAMPAPRGQAPCFAMHRSLADEAYNAQGERLALRSLQDQAYEAVAAVARPETFFAMLADTAGQPTHTQALPDHYNFEGFERRAAASMPLLCTEKDASKLWQQFPQAWAVPLQLQLPPGFWQLLAQRLGPPTGPRRSA